MKFLHTIKTGLIIFLLTNQCLAQQQLFTSYTVSQGLVNNAVRKIYQDKEGFIWIGTWEGLSRYDGYRFLNFTPSSSLPFDMVNDIIESPDGDLLVAMNNGATVAFQKGRMVDPYYYRDVTINEFYKDKSQGLLAVTDLKGVISLGKKTVRQRSQAGNMFSMMRRKNGSYLAAGEWQVLGLNNDMVIQDRYPIGFTSAQCLLEDHSGNLWIGTENGLKRLAISGTDAGSSKIEAPPEPFNHPLLLQGGINCMFQDFDSSLWFGTFSGLIRVSKNLAVKIFTVKDGLPSNRVSYIMRDREKNLWVGTFSGLAKMGVQSVDILELPGNPGPHHIYNLQTDGSGNFLVITSEGVFRYRSGEPFHLLLQSGKKDAPFLVAQSRPLKLVTRNQLYAYDSGGDKLVFEKKFPLSSGVFCSAESASSIAFGYDRGLQLFFPGKQPVLLLDSVRIQTIHYDQKGDLWVGTWYEGLYRVKIDNLNGRVRYIDTLTSDVGTAFIRSMLIDKKENIWVGTRYNGIVRLSPRPGGNFSKTVFDRKQGLLSDWVYCLSESAEGDIWVGTLSGINKLVPFGNGYRVFNFSRVLNFYATVNSIVTFPGKNVICSSDKGVLRFTETGLEKQEALPVIITNVHLGQSDSNYAISGRNIRLKYFQNYAGFEFTSTGYVNEKEMLYSYRLMGSADTGWSLPASVHAVEYASLKPGNYRFEVRMFGWNGYYGPVNGFPFHIGKPWWQTGVFYGLLALLVTGLLYMFYQYRIRQLVRIHQVRNHIATDLHDDIGSTLTNISILSELSMKTLQQPAVASQFLSRIKDEVQSSNQALDDIIWSVNSRNDSMQETIARMRRFAGDLFDNTSTLCHLEIAEPAPGRRLNMEQRRDLYLIYKESLTNIYKHAAAKNVWIRIKLSPQWLDLEIEDDGKGFETDILTHRNGLKNLRFRVEKWQGSLQLDSVAGKGTRIVIKWPVGNSVPS